MKWLIVLCAWIAWGFAMQRPGLSFVAGKAVTTEKTPTQIALSASGMVIFSAAFLVLWKPTK